MPQVVKLTTTVVPAPLRSMLLLISIAWLSAACSSLPNKADDKKAAQFNAELGAKYLQRNELIPARDKLEKALEQNDNNALAQVTYGRLLQRIGKIKKARPYFVKGIKLEPEVADHRNSYGIYLCETGELSNAEKEFKLAASNPYYETPEYALDNAGLCLLDAGNMAEAEVYLRDALRTNPKFPSAWLHMAQLTYQQKRLTVAEAYLSRYREFVQDTAPGLLLALNIKRDMGDSSAAKNYADRLLSDFPTSNEAGEYLARPL